MADESQALALSPVQGNLASLQERFQPKSLTELMTWSDMVVNSGLALKGQNRAAVVLCVQMGAEVGVSPAQAIQNICVINGKPSIYGDLGLALFKRDSKIYATFEERAPDKAYAQGEGWCKIVLKDGTVVERTFSVDEARRAGLWTKQGPWQQYPGDMLMWRARWKAMRSTDPGVFKGLAAREEQEYIIDAETRQPARSMPRTISAPDEITPQQVAALQHKSVIQAAEKVAPAQTATNAPQTTQPPKEDAKPIPPPPEPKADGLPTWHGVIREASLESGTTNKKPWQLIRIKGDGFEAVSFHVGDDDKAIVKELKGSGEEVLIEYKVTPKGNQIENIGRYEQPPTTESMG